MPRSQHHSQQLKQALETESGSFFMEAHNSIAAMVVENSGFDGIWASSLSLSSVLGKRDANEVSWTQLVDCAGDISSSVDLPVLLDGDNALGDFNTMRQIVTRADRLGIAGIAVEDTTFPKINSLLDRCSSLQSLDTFCGIIKAGKDSQLDENFCVIARTEALIIGHPISEALTRAAAYIDSGADAVLVHSKKNDGKEILEFLKQWARYGPVVLVPTTYYATDTRTMFDAGANLVIWANHLVRASLYAMRAVAEQVHKHKSVSCIEASISSLDELFEFMQYHELDRAKRKYK